MFELVFGIIWTLFTSIFAFVFISAGDDVPSLLVLMLIAFVVIGVYLIFIGAKKVIKDSKTNKFGIECFGIVRSVEPTNVYINDRPQYRTNIDIVNPNTLQLEQLSEVTGTNYYKYPINSYVKCKYYEGDINIIGMIIENDIPGDYKKLLVPNNNSNTSFSDPFNPAPPSYSDISFSEDRQTVTIDGETYIKK